MNLDKTGFICFKKDDDISSSPSKLMKSVDQFVYFSSNISSTKNDVNIHSSKVWNAFDMLLIIWKVDLFDEIRWEFFQFVVSFDFVVSRHNHFHAYLKSCQWYCMTAPFGIKLKGLEKKARLKLHCRFKYILEKKHTKKTIVVRPPTYHLTNNARRIIHAGYCREGMKN